MAINPSLLIIPDRFKASKLYSQLPESGDGDFTVVRGTTATRVNASGLIESVASGVPRLDYTGGGCPALLVEPAATNLVLYSEEFNNAEWARFSEGSAVAPAVTANAGVAPNGTMTADRVDFVRTGTTGADNSIMRQTVTTTIGNSLTLSFFIKAFSPTDVGKQIAVRHVGTDYVIITLTSEYQKITTTQVSANNSVRFENRGTITPDLSVSVLIWGAQLELGSVATSYIPTVASTVTRNADVITLSSASGLIGQTEGVVYVEVDLRNIPVNSDMFELSDGTSSNRIRIRRLGSVTIALARIKSGEPNIQISSIISSSGKFKMAFAYSPNANGYEVFINGVSTAVLATASATFTNELNKIDIGSNAAGTAQLNDRISAAAFYTTRLSNAELIALTTL